MSKGLIIAAPASGAGKTTVTLGLLRALNRTGHMTRSFKSGPDYIDPAFHAAATGQPCLNLDAWAMSSDRLSDLITAEADFIIEGAMGLFDGAPPMGKGATADLARQFGLPVVLVVNAASMSHSVAAVVRGFATHDPDVQIAGVILNNVGSERHGAMLRSALAPLDIPVLGTLPRSANLARPSRHLGLVQAGEMPDLDRFLATAADHVATHVDLIALSALMAPPRAPGPRGPRDRGAAPKTIALAQDAAFSFSYPHQIADWQAAGTKILPFSPLADDAVPEAEAVFLPGGYPELHAACLAANQTFMQSLKVAAQTSDIYGECGGYMTLGETLIDADGTPHKMAGLLGLTTSFAIRKLHLGYRHLTGRSPHKPGRYTAHEFHYATTVDAQGTPLFDATDAEGTPLPPMGLTEGRVAGSFAHIIDRA
ncbi:cobyrinate a,c-diamide synthase [Pseudooctadecabacter sp.]|uniref:cobyrinate a,c-diamide synthase n=2 Tax=Pseudooctadecabacter sp. TaxID=1966338 RepID=UPI0035C7E00B